MTKSRNQAPRFAVRRDYSAPALEKGLDVLELLADGDGGLTISEISERLGRRMSELFRIIIVLENRGWLRKDPESARYSITYHVLRVAHRGTPAQTLTHAAAPVMHELSTRINQSCHLVVRSGIHGLVILRQENPKRHANLSVRLGSAMDLVSTCSGQLLLAHLDAQERAQVLQAVPRPWKISRASLEKTLERIGRRGYEVQPSSITKGVTDISYPVYGFEGRAVAALTIPYLHVLDDSLPTSVEQTRRLVEEAARQISRAIGGAR